ncbi:permease [Halomarina litorea]|uniref:permease n=1 Tax=Halomarina litorea TaxID=2961595 RepID=UPI0020C50C2A|nr:permease [Halomarina sp. BCD28]
MNLRTVTLGLASAVTTFLLVGAILLEVLGGLYGESPGVGILGVSVGFAAGLGAGVVVAATADRLSGVTAAALIAYGAFGVAFLAVAGLRYVNVPGADEVFTLPVHLAVSLVVALVAAALAERTQAADGTTSA